MRYSQPWIIQSQMLHITCILSLATKVIFADIRDPVVDLNLKSEEVLIEKWNEYKTTFHKDYKTQEEDDYRFHIFSDNLKQLQRWNDASEDTNKYGITKYADLTKEEMYRHTGFVPEGLEL